MRSAQSNQFDGVASSTIWWSVLAGMSKHMYRDKKQTHAQRNKYAREASMYVRRDQSQPMFIELKACTCIGVRAN